MDGQQPALCMAAMQGRDAGRVQLTAVEAMTVDSRNMADLCSRLFRDQSKLTAVQRKQQQSTQSCCRLYPPSFKLTANFSDG